MVKDIYDGYFPLESIINYGQLPLHPYLPDVVITDRKHDGDSAQVVPFLFYKYMYGSNFKKCMTLQSL